MRTGFGLIIIVIMLAALPASAEFYKYVDENGNTRFTDDLTMVPPDQREKFRPYAEEADKPEAASDAGATPPAEPPAPPADSEEGRTPEEDLVELGKRLEEEQAALDREYKALMEERKTIESQRQEFRTKRAMKEYEAQITTLNERNAAYEERRAAFDREVTGYNDRVEAFKKQSAE